MADDDELADMVDVLPDWPMWALVPAGVLFAVLNSVLEEAVYRGSSRMLWIGFSDPVWRSWQCRRSPSPPCTS